VRKSPIPIINESFAVRTSDAAGGRVVWVDPGFVVVLNRIEVLSTVYMSAPSPEELLAPDGYQRPPKSSHIGGSGNPGSCRPPKNYFRKLLKGFKQ
jgi:hypothetical protein